MASFSQASLFSKVDHLHIVSEVNLKGNLDLLSLD